ncbi:methyltransferase [Actinopolyspora erythraea]|uniref:thymidylate synthase n=1 Tax=Actinopolyspora erythraea TaxID=414996 RepID=A0A099D467_9ACTN|nr:thymidylate synthase [Actinopolyspora erythraea]ASU81099.1 methyltransferase [Actinopolyspora erythraea]KGI80587.1 methyltransferase [Actinopolyspora erythraea]
MLSLSADDASDLFIRTSHSVARDGRATAPRGLSTTEILGAELVLQQPRNRFVDATPVRVLNPAFAAAEALWILSGSEDSWIFTFNERLRRFTDHGRLQGAYGPRLRRWRDEVDQLDVVRRKLSSDPATRQAVITLFDPSRDFAGYRDVPCTLGYRFWLRDGALHMFTSMRSQDAWLGLPYDLFTFTILQELLAGWLDVELGNYHHLVDSLHLYEQHLDAAADAPDHLDLLPEMLPLTVPWEDFDEMMNQLIAGETVGHRGWDDFATVLTSYRLWKTHDVDNARSLVTDAEQPLSQALSRWYDRLETSPTSIASAPVAPLGRSA